jgi:hypothetical protein
MALTSFFDDHIPETIDYRSEDKSSTFAYKAEGICRYLRLSPIVCSCKRIEENGMIGPQASQRRSAASSSEEPFHQSDGLSPPRPRFSKPAQYWNSNSTQHPSHTIFRYAIECLHSGPPAGKGASGECS